MREPKNQVTHNAVTADGVAVFCAFTKIAPETELELHPRNPNQHSPEQLRLYLKIIRTNGWRRPVVVSKRSGFVTKGNGALMAVRLGRLKSVPVDYQDYPSEEAETEDLIADNELARLATSDDNQLKSLLKDLESKGCDLELAGILKRLDEPVELKPLIILPPPKMAWVLIGIPLVHYARITAHIERIAADAEAIVETTVGDECPDASNQENRQP